MTRTPIVTGFLAAAMIMVGLVGCGGAPDPAASTPTAADVVSTEGLGPIRFGEAREDLEREHGLVQRSGDCMPRLPAYPSASPVLDGDRLVLLWAEPPLRTPDGLTVGSPVTQVRQAYPEAQELAAPPESFQFDGLLVPVDDRAYLFLHDQDRVQKLIVGYERHARLLFTESFGTC